MRLYGLDHQRHTQPSTAGKKRVQYTRVPVRLYGLDHQRLTQRSTAGKKIAKDKSAPLRLYGLDQREESIVKKERK